jgi:hypothetical protein
MQVSVGAPNLVGGQIDVEGERVMHRFQGMCDNELIVGKWRYLKIAHPHPPIILQEATFEMQRFGID